MILRLSSKQELVWQWKESVSRASVPSKRNHTWELCEMKSEGHTESAPSITGLGKLVSPLTGHYRKRASPCMPERWPPPLTTAQGDRTLRAHQSLKEGWFCSGET